MKVKIGKYINYFGPFQLADLLQYVGVSNERCYSIGEFLAETKLYEFMEWIHSKRKRKVEVKIDSYDTWNMDYTLALIICPMLKQLRKDTHSFGIVDNSDAPVTLAEYPELKWNYILDEMIWAFNQLSDPEEELKFYDEEKRFFDREGYDANQERIKNGLRLFGKYYQSLWD